MRNTVNSSPPSHLPTLVVDSNGVAANQLAEQLIHRGFPTDVATGYPAARAATRSRHYGALVVIADFIRTVDLEGVRTLRTSVPNAWIVVINSRPHPDAHRLILERCADSLLVAPFSVEDLTDRLAAFSRRSRV